MQKKPPLRSTSGLRLGSMFLVEVCLEEPWNIVLSAANIDLCTILTTRAPRQLLWYQSKYLPWRPWYDHYPHKKCAILLELNSFVLSHYSQSFPILFHAIAIWTPPRVPGVAFEDKYCFVTGRWGTSPPRGPSLPWEQALSASKLKYVKKRMATNIFFTKGKGKQFKSLISRTSHGYFFFFWESQWFSRQYFCV